MARIRKGVKKLKETNKKYKEVTNVHWWRKTFAELCVGLFEEILIFFWYILSIELNFLHISIQISLPMFRIRQHIKESWAKTHNPVLSNLKPKEHDGVALWIVIPNNHSRVIHWKIKSHYWKCILGQLVLKTVFSTVRSCTNHGLGYVFGFIYGRVIGAN